MAKIEVNKQLEDIKKVASLNEGKNLKYCILTMGCQLNENDSEKLCGMMESMNYSKTENLSEANLIVFNTCCVRENAEDKLFGKLGEVKKYKEAKGTIIAIGGCMMQEKHIVDKLKQSYPFFDIVFGTHTLQEFPTDLYNVLCNKKRIEDVLDIDGDVIEGLPISRDDKIKASVTIMNGCNNFCSYCIVPYVRGRERSREPKDIINEVKKLAEQGYKEITLLGQNVNSYLRNEKYFEKMQSQMQKFEYSTTVKKEQIEEYNQYFTQYPLACFRNSFSWKEQNILAQMSTSSEFAISTLFKENTIYIDKFVPYIKKIDLSQKDSFDNIVCKYLDDIQIKYAEQLLNSNIEPVAYLRSIYESYSLTLSTFITTINENNYKKMYKDIEDGFLKYGLLPYPDRVSVAHITQLIPLVELLIRELGIKNNIIPFKEKEQQIHVMKDSSTILLSIIRKKFKESNNFENMGIYLYLYNYLYNNNSLNIRNELIHARQYLDSEGQMNFAFRALIIGIFWGSIELYI